MQTQNRIFDDIARLFSNAAGAAQGVREEIEVLVRGQAERWAAELDLVTREEFEAVRAMALAARAEADALAQRTAQLEAALAQAGLTGAQPPSHGMGGSAAPLPSPGATDAVPSDAGEVETPLASGGEEGPGPQPGI